MTKKLVGLALAAILGAFAWVIVRGRGVPAAGMDGAWKMSCVTGDDRYLVAGGDHAALIELQSGKRIDRIPGVVTAVGCAGEGAFVIAGDKAWRLPGKAELTPVPAVKGAVIGVGEDGSWISAAVKGAPALFVANGASVKQTLLPPSRFGKVGAREAPASEGFAVQVGNLLEDGRVVAAAGWVPQTNDGSPQSLSWGFFAVDPKTGAASPMTLPFTSDDALNPGLAQRVAAAPDGMHLVIAAHDGRRLTVAQYDQGANVASKVTTVEATAAPSSAAISGSGTLVAVSLESGSAEGQARALLIDQAGKVIWNRGFRTAIVGLHFLDEGTLVVASAGGEMVKVSQAGAELWRTP